MAWKASDDKSRIYSTGRYYQFTNIHHAELPLDSLRFAQHVPPRKRSREIVNGTGLGYTYSQSQAFWFNVQNDLSVPKPQDQFSNLPLRMTRSMDWMAAPTDHSL